MSRKELKPWGLVVTLSMIICLFVYTGTGPVSTYMLQEAALIVVCDCGSLNTCVCVCVGSGVCGYLTFGSSVSQDVLMSYPSNDIAVAFARAFIVICVVTSYPILHFCGRLDKRVATQHL